MAIRITYDSKNIDLEIGPDGLVSEFAHESRQNRSGSGHVETINQYGDEVLTFSSEFSESTYYDLIAWWSWARQGKSWSFAMDSTQTGNTTLDDAAASGQKNVPLTETSAFSAGDICMLAMDDDDAFEVVEIDSVDAGVKIVAVDDLKFSYASGDSFRHLNYYPDVFLLASPKFKPLRTGDVYFYTFNFTVRKQ